MKNQKGFFFISPIRKPFVGAGLLALLSPLLFGPLRDMIRAQ